jgi:hypothetical protein
MAIGADGGINLHAVGIALSVENPDGLDIELGLIDLALGDLGDSDKNAVV